MSDRRTIAALWHGATFLVIAVSIVVQLMLVIRGHAVLVESASSTPLAERLLRFFSYFTIQSNVLAAATALSLINHPDRDGRTWRVLRAAAVVGMTVTFITYVVVLRPIVHLHGIAKLTDIGFHYVAPFLTIAGWLIFGPWPRFDVESLVRVIAWPFSYLIYVLVLGAISGWYPYPFIDVAKLGYARVLLNAFVVTLLLFVVGAIVRALDSKRGGTQPRPLV